MPKYKTSKFIIIFQIQYLMLLIKLQSFKILLEEPFLAYRIFSVTFRRGVKTKGACTSQLYNCALHIFVSYVIYKSTNYDIYKYITTCIKQNACVSQHTQKICSECLQSPEFAASPLRFHDRPMHSAPEPCCASEPHTASQLEPAPWKSFLFLAVHRATNGAICSRLPVYQLFSKKPQ